MGRPDPSPRNDGEEDGDNVECVAIPFDDADSPRVTLGVFSRAECST